MDRYDVRLSIVTLIILIIFWGILVYYSSQAVPPPPPNTTSDTQLPVRAPSRDPYLQDCPPGQCAMNLFNGEKRCPTNSKDIIQANITLEACNPRESCINGILPYAILPNGSTSLEGLCQPGVACRCTAQPSCASYISAFFETVDGNPYVSTNGQRTRFRQDILASDGVLPVTFNPLTTFCQVPIDWLPRSSPGCTILPGQNGEGTVMTPESITECMTSESGACLVGTLAFISSTSEFGANDINRIPLACVKEKPCPIGYINIYDTSLGGIVCTKIV